MFLNVAQAQEITVAVASNMQFAFEEIKNEFEVQYGQRVKSVIGSSGKLTAQIEYGAPFDIFISADTKYPYQLFDHGFGKLKPKTYAFGSLVLWTIKDVNLSENISGLKENNFERIAIADPSSAPYGEQALKAFSNTGVLNTVQPKIIYGQSIAQVNQYVLSGHVDVGITAKSVVLDPQQLNKGHWVDVSTDLYESIEQAAVLLNDRKEVMKFYQFLFSEQAQKILMKYGYEIPE